MKVGTHTHCAILARCNVVVLSPLEVASCILGGETLKVLKMNNLRHCAILARCNVVVLSPLEVASCILGGETLKVLKMEPIHNGCCMAS